MKKGKIFALVISILLIFSTIILGYKGFKKYIKYKVLGYHQEMNEDGIAVDMSDNPYFMTKQPGYMYPSPDTITYHSEITGTDRHAMVLLPHDYDEDKEYPVLYLLHGLNGSHRAWRNKHADIIIHNLNYFEGVPEMIVVFPNSAVNEEENTDNLSLEEKVKVYDLMGEDLISSLMPYINSHYSVKTGKENTALAGYSMGGRETLYTAFSHQDLFGYIGAFSSAHVLGDLGYDSIMPSLVGNFTIDPDTGGFDLIMLCVGRQDDDCGEETYKIHDNMSLNGIDHIFYDTEGGHENSVWQNALYNFAKKIFRNSNM